MTRLHEDRVISGALSVAVVGLALQIAALTAYFPLALIGPDPSRSSLLLWIMPAWIGAVTAGATMLLRSAYRKWLA